MDTVKFEDITGLKFSMYGTNKESITLQIFESSFRISVFMPNSKTPALNDSAPLGAVEVLLDMIKTIKTASPGYTDSMEISKYSETSRKFELHFRIGLKKDDDGMYLVTIDANGMNTVTSILKTGGGIERRGQRIPDSALSGYQLNLLENWLKVYVPVLRCLTNAKVKSWQRKGNSNKNNFSNNNSNNDNSNNNKTSGESSGDPFS